MRSLTQYLRDNEEAGIIDFAFRAWPTPDGGYQLAVHPDGEDGETLDLVALADDTIVVAGDTKDD